jgi:osmotically-inducible protein OsmY
VTLSGVVATRDDVREAALDAADVDGVVAVRNQLRPH